MIFTNQIRMKIGVMFGSPETTSGGNALKFYASVRLDVRRIGAIKEAGPPGKDMVVVGNRTRVKVVKNKLAAPFREVEFDILYGQGVSRSGEIVDMASDLNIVQKSGAWFSVDGERIGQGRDNARTYLEQHPALLDKLEQKILAASGITRPGEAAPAASAAPPAEGKPSGKGEADGARPAPNGSQKPRQPTPARPS
jgi:recombination protein RecA